MLDLDKYINNEITVKLYGKELHVFEPSIKMIEEIDKLEKNMDKNNSREIRVKVAAIMLSHNKEGTEIREEEVKKLPYEAVIAVINTLASMRLEADQDPN